MSKERELLARVAFETVHNNGISEKLYGEIEAYLAEPVQEQEPVAWMSKTYPVTFATQKNIAQPTMFFTPLYATPPDAAKRIKQLEFACSKMNDEISQTLGKALDYPWFKDDQENFTGADETHGVCVGDQVAETLAIDAAKRIAELEDHLEHEKLCIKDYVHAIAALKEKINDLESRISNGVRVYAHRDNIDGFTAATNRDLAYTKKWKANAILILDEVE
jgi:hypothetical protein